MLRAPQAFNRSNSGLTKVANVLSDSGFPNTIVMGGSDGGPRRTFIQGGDDDGRTMNITLYEQAGGTQTLLDAYVTTP